MFYFMKKEIELHKNNCQHYLDLMDAVESGDLELIDNYFNLCIDKIKEIECEYPVVEEGDLFDNEVKNELRYPYIDTHKYSSGFGRYYILTTITLYVCDGDDMTYLYSTLDFLEADDYRKMVI